MLGLSSRPLDAGVRELGYGRCGGGPEGIRTPDLLNAISSHGCPPGSRVHAESCGRWSDRTVPSVAAGWRPPR